MRSIGNDQVITLVTERPVTAVYYDSRSAKYSHRQNVRSHWDDDGRERSDRQRKPSPALAPSPSFADTVPPVTPLRHGGAILAPVSAQLSQQDVKLYPDGDATRETGRRSTSPRRPSTSSVNTLHRAHHLKHYHTTSQPLLPKTNDSIIVSEYASGAGVSNDATSGVHTTVDDALLRQARLEIQRDLHTRERQRKLGVRPPA